MEIYWKSTEYSRKNSERKRRGVSGGNESGFHPNGTLL